MSRWQGRAGLFRVGPSASLRTVVLQAQGAGETPYVVAPSSSKATFLERLGEALHFPDWAGHNWDAAADLLRDLSWLPAGPVVVVWAEPELLGNADPAAYREAVEILGATARQHRSRRLTVLLVDN